MRAARSSWGLLCAAVALAQTAPEVASVEGVVTHSMTNAPVARAHIALRATGPNAKTYGALTNAEGKFSITGVPPGRYAASTDRVGFFTPAFPGGRTWIELTLRAGDKKDDLKLRLAPLGSIAGRVVDAEGEPVESALVAVDTGQGTNVSIRSNSDDKGRFQLLGLAPGKYRVRAAVASPMPTPPEIRTDGSVEVRYAPTYFGGATEYKSAAMVQVGTGAEVSGIEIRLVRMPMVRISGKVLGGPAETRGVTLNFSQTTGTRGFSGVKKDGTFEVWNVDPGKYLLTASWSSGNQRVQTSPVSVEVGQTHIANLELQLVPASDVSGRVVFEDEDARPPAPSQAGQRGAAPAGTGNTARPNPQAGPARVQLGTVDPGMMIYNVNMASNLADDGAFRISEVPAARYRVQLSWPSAYVKSVTLGSQQVEGNVLNLRNGAAGAQVTVVVSSAFGAISGTVSDDGTPAGGARVALVRDDFVSLGDVTFVTTDSDGVYRISNVRPGKYRIVVVEENDNAPRAGNLDDYDDILARIEVQAKDKLTRDLKRHAPVR